MSQQSQIARDNANGSVRYSTGLGNHPSSANVHPATSPPSPPPCVPACSQPFADGLFMKTAAGPRFQPEPRKWRPSASKKRARPTLADASGTMAFMRITQTHGDSVVTLPADSQVLGTSRSCTNEIFLTGKVRAA